MWPAESGSPHNGHLVSLAFGSPLRYGMLYMKAVFFVPQLSTSALEKVHLHGLRDCWHVPEGISILGSCHRLDVLPTPGVNRVLVALAQLDFGVYFILQGIMQVSHVLQAWLVITVSVLLCLKPKLVVKNLTTAHVCNLCSAVPIIVIVMSTFCPGPGFTDTSPRKSQPGYIYTPLPTEFKVTKHALCTQLSRWVLMPSQNCSYVEHPTLVGPYTTTVMYPIAP